VVRLHQDIASAVKAGDLKKHGQVVLAKSLDEAAAKLTKAPAAPKKKGEE
jgi:hypothetical protein